MLAQHFDGDVAVERLFVSLINDAHSTATQLAHHFVVADLLRQASFRHGFPMKQMMKTIRRAGLPCPYGLMRLCRWSLWRWKASPSHRSLRFEPLPRGSNQGLHRNPDRESL